MKLAGRGFKNIQNCLLFCFSRRQRRQAAVGAGCYAVWAGSSRGISCLDVMAGFGTFWARPSTGIGCSGNGFRGAAAEAWGLSWQVKA